MFRNRVFPNKIGLSITNLDIIGVIEDDEIFSKLSDDDSIRLYLLLALEVIFMGLLLTFKVDDTLFSLVENIEAWNSFPWGKHLWCHLYDEIKNLKERHGDEHYYGAPPIKEHYGLFETYLSKLEKARKRGKTSFMVSSIRGTTDNIVLAHERSNRKAKLKFTNEFSSMTSDLCNLLNSMFADLIELADPDEDIAQDYLREEELRLCLEGEEKMRCEHQKLIIEENRIRLDEAKSHSFVSLNEHHIDLWVDYMWHVRPENSNWAMVSCYFVKLLLQNGMPLFYANGEKYTTPWSEVFIPINETGEHWCLAQFHIMSGEVTFYDIRHIYDYDCRDWLAHGLSLDVDDPIDVALVIDDSTENYSLFKVNYDGMLDERPSSYEDVYGGGCFNVSGSFKGNECIKEPVGCDDSSLSVKIKDEFENKVILDDVVSSPANFSMLLKRKGKSRVKFTRMKGIIKRSKMVSLRMRVRSNY
ncbi:phospholipase-like protein [Tanacetum coccineum]